MDSRRVRGQTAAWRTAAGASAVWLALTVAAAATVRAQELPDALKARLLDIPAGSREATAGTCASLAREIESAGGMTPHQRAAGLNALRTACAPKLAWTDPVLTGITLSLVSQRRALESDEPAPLCEALIALGTTYTYQSRPEEALRVYREAVAISRRYLGRGTTDEDLAASLEAQTSGLLDRRNFQAAMATAEESLRLTRQAVPYRPEQVVTALVTRALVEEALDLRTTKATLIEAHSLAAGLGPGFESIAGRVAHNLGNILYRLGELPQAITLLEEAERLRSGASGGRPDRRLASTQTALGDVYFDAGDYPQAIEYYRKAVAGHRVWVGEDSSRYCDALTRLGTVLEASGQWEEALKLQRDALAIREAAARAAPSPANSEVQLSLARSLVRLGALQHRMGTPEAGASLERALAIQDAALAGTPSAAHAEGLLEFAEFRRDAGDPRSALELVGRCRRELTVLGEQGPLQLRAIELAARLAESPNAGLQLLEEAYRLARQLYGTGSPWSAGILQVRAELRLRLGDSHGALRDALQAQEISLPQVRAVVQAFPRDQALAFAADRRGSLDLALRLVAEGPDPGMEMVGRVWRTALSSRMLVLNAEIDRKRLLQATADPELSSESKRLAAARERYAHLLMRGEITTTVRRTQLRVSKHELDELETELAAKLRHRRSSAPVRAASLGELRHRLPGDAALVAFFQYRSSAAGSDAYLAFVLGTDGHPRAVPLGRVVEIDSRIQSWREAILGAGSDAAARRRAGKALREDLWDPIARRLGDTRRVFVVPDGSVYLVPLMALPASDDRYLIEHGWEFQTLTAERDLLAENLPRRPGPWLAVGGIDYDQAAPQIVATSATSTDVLHGAAIDAGVAEQRGEQCPSGGLPLFEALPGSREEIEELATLWRRLHARSTAAAALTLLRGREATKPALLRSIAGQRVVHLATHGFAVSRGCGLARPAARGIGGLSLEARDERTELDRLAGLVLAGANDRTAGGGDAQEGILTETEILDLDLSAADWVVLSACDTGLGTIQAREGVVGMLRSFQVAGARTIIASLWSVDDQAAHQWMGALYGARFERRLSTMESVRQAALLSLQHSRRLGDDNPARWAGFMATGQWR
jgi:CHAT domain-containing protein/tetratricopeptide (TPR) repeat protein